MLWFRRLKEPVVYRHAEFLDFWAPNRLCGNELTDEPGTKECGVVTRRFGLKSAESGLFGAVT